MDVLDTSAVRRMAVSPRADEIGSLRGWLDFHRATFARNLHGLTAEQLRAQPLPQTDLSLLGLLRHHTDGELVLFRNGIAGGNATLHHGDNGEDFAHAAGADVRHNGHADLLRQHIDGRRGV